MALMRGRFFLGSGTRINAARATVIADDSGVEHDGSVVNVSDVCHAHVGDVAVVVERSAAPLTANKSHPGIAESVVDSAIEADVRSPVSWMPRVGTSTPTPISGCPEHADRGHNPGAGHPVITIVITPSPITGSPEVTWAGTDGLRINR